MNWRALFEPKQPFIKARLNGEGTAYVVPISEINEIVQEAMSLEDPDRLACEIVWMRPSEVEVLPEFDGF